MLEKPGTGHFPRGSNPEQGAAGEPRRQPQELGCVCPREQISMQDSNVDGSKDKFPWQGPSSGWGQALEEMA